MRPTPCWAVSAVGPKGADATQLELPDGMPLNGAGVGIGQVEGMRPGKPIANGGPDQPANSASTVVPATAFSGTSTASNGDYTLIGLVPHAQEVASIMISTHATSPRRRAGGTTLRFCTSTNRYGSTVRCVGIILHCQPQWG
jgi:hypothetical protein